MYTTTIWYNTLQGGLDDLEHNEATPWLCMYLDGGQQQEWWEVCQRAPDRAKCVWIHRTEQDQVQFSASRRCLKLHWWRSIHEQMISPKRRAIFESKCGQIYIVSANSEISYRPLEFKPSQWRVNLGILMISSLSWGSDIAHSRASDGLIDVKWKTYWSNNLWGEQKELATRISR